MRSCRAPRGRGAGRGAGPPSTERRGRMRELAPLEAEDSEDAPPV